MDQEQHQKQRARTKVTGKGHLLSGIDLLLAEENHAVLKECLLELLGRQLVKGLGEVEAMDNSTCQW
jgi:hypothetical protein